MADELSALNGYFEKYKEIDEFGILIALPQNMQSSLSTSTMLHTDNVVIKDNKLAITFELILNIFNHVQSKFYLLKDSYNNSDDIYNLISYSRVMLILNADLLTVWNSRKKLFIDTYLVFNQELLFTSFILSKHPKSSETWAHRRWIIERNFTAEASSWLNLNLNDFMLFLNKEINICERVSQIYPKNYHSWTYRKWIFIFVVRTYMETNSYCIDIWIDILSQELKKLENWTRCHLNDHSGFHMRQVILMELVALSKHDLHSFKFIEDISYDNCLYCDYFRMELDYINHLLNNFSGHESIWYHKKFLLKLIKLQSCHLPLESIITETFKTLNSEIELCLMQEESDFLDKYESNRRFCASYRLYLVQQYWNFLSKVSHKYLSKSHIDYFYSHLIDACNLIRYVHPWQTACWNDIEKGIILELNNFTIIN